jgi:sugar phosphate isomerase/epimerase
MPMQIAVSEFSTPRWSFHQDVIKYASRGINKIGISRRKVDDIGTSEAADLLFEMKMGVSSVSWAGGFTGSDGTSYVDAIDDAIESIVFASQINADCLIVYPGGRNGHTNRHACRLFENALDTLIPIAADYNIPLAIEPMVGRESRDWSSLGSYRAFFGLLDNFPTEYLGCVVDLFHCGLNKSLLSEFQKHADRIGVVQVADRHSNNGHGVAQRLLPGSGDIDFGYWFDGLAASGVDCGIELEVYGYQNQSIEYDQRLIALKSCVANHACIATSSATA